MYCSPCPSYNNSLPCPSYNNNYNCGNSSYFNPYCSSRSWNPYSFNPICSSLGSLHSWNAYYPHSTIGSRNCNFQSSPARELAKLVAVFALSGIIVLSVHCYHSLNTY